MSNTNYKQKYLHYKQKYIDLKSNSCNQTINVGDILLATTDKTIVGFGQATHGQHLINKYCVDFFKLLVKKQNFTIFVIEDSYIFCKTLNDYIKGINTTEINKLIKNLMWVWRSYYLVELFEWMKKYNEKHNNVLSFCGIDYLLASDNEMAKNNVTNDDTINYIKETVTKHNKKYKWNENTYQYDSPKYKNFNGDNFRDKIMFDIFMKFYDPSNKYFIYMHNSHIAKQIEKKNNITYKHIVFFINKL